MMTVTEEGGWRELFSGKNGASALALSVGVALPATNIYIATTILPSVVRDIGGLELYAWSTTLFVVASIIGSVLTARLLVLFGPRSAYLVAGLLFALGSLLCALAPSMEILLLGRSVQGLGGGMLFALSYAMINLLFREALWPRTMALTSGMWGIATLVGPAIGGVFAQFDLWRMAFGSLVPITALYMVLSLAILPPRKARPQRIPPLPGGQLLLLTAAVLLLSSGSLISDIPTGIALLLVVVLLLALLSWRENRAHAHLLPQGALRPSTPLAALYATMSLLAMAMTAEIFAPYFLQVLHGQTPLIAGYLAATMAAGWTISEILSSGWRERGIRLAIVSGPALAAAGLLVLALTMPNASDGSLARLLPIGFGLTLIGFGIGLGWPHLLTRILQNAPVQDKELAGASITTVQSFATALGAALAGMLANLAGLNVPGGVAGASNAAFWLFALFALAPLLALFTALRVVAVRRPTVAFQSSR